MSRISLAGIVVALLSPAAAAPCGEIHPAEWTIYVANDKCPDYTWGLTEEQTRQAFADVVRGHLDEMERTDGQAAENRDRYNMAVAQEALCFVENLVTVYAELDRVDFDLRVEKQPTGDQERLCHVFPLLGEGASLRAATSGAIVRPRPQPEGDLLPGADTRRLAVQEYVSVADETLAVTLVPHDAFVLRLDLDPITFEALGNDQNYREVLHDQDGQTSFRFRYSLRAGEGGYRGPEAIAFARSAAAPLSLRSGRLAVRSDELPGIEVDAARAVATCLKPADDPEAGGILLRIWETAGQEGPLPVRLRGFAKAGATDLLERDQAPLEIRDGAVEVKLRPHGYAALRLVP